MEERKILVQIEQLEEDGETFFHATCPNDPDLAGVLVYGETIEDIFREAPAVIKSVISCKAKREHLERLMLEMLFEFYFSKKDRLAVCE